MPAPLPIFDGHNDLLLRLYRKDPAHAVRIFLEGDGAGHLDLPRMRRGGFAGGFFAIFVPEPDDDPRADDRMVNAAYDLPLPTPLERSYAQGATLTMAAILLQVERESRGAVRICRAPADLDACRDSGALAAILHVEGAEAIDPNLHMLEVLHAAGLRSLGPVWSRNNIFGNGVPFRFPSTGDIGPGLTDHGRALVRRCNRLGIMVDLSHLTEAGFWDVARISDAPLVATHSNAHAVSPHSRNLTDRQLDAIAESRGMVGVNFATSFIRPDGRKDARTSLDELLRHFDHLIERLGVDGVGLGSDFDGATVPQAIGDVTGLPRLVDAMRRHGYDDATVRKLAYENWVGLLKRTWA
ncbi:dipeptidase [Salinarimonas soli]|uniref:Membrane dipeptidase n=1 Tax=Salinarimonas soli TaxID=1638099 RepID=A0A5B2VHS5_9HYPH|nr:dipeptidase [Salinarimonas soli]KAA2237747.1 membrane dipeptidase [Salinarimonas soli]